LLHLEEIDIGYGDLQILHSVSLHINENEIVALIGANGAGKSTLINTISGLMHPRKGQIIFLGERIDRKEPHFIVEKGIVQVPEGRMIFSSLTILENLEMGSFISRAKKKRKVVLERVLDLFPRLKDRINQVAGTLSGGEQQMLCIGRALMSLPNLLMLDEPSLGLAPLVVSDIFEVISTINGQGTTVLLVEQNIEYTLEMANRGYVLENGIIVLEGMCKELLLNAHVKEAYLGI
jgi:branched-chain amino acid transport system ATP-binding protein